MSSLSTRHYRVLGFLLLALVAASLIRADDAAATAPKIIPYGDLRLRYERDWDSQTSAGVPRANRDRERARVRLGLNIDLDPEWSLNVRGRTGDPHSQQSPHLTFDSSDHTHDDLKAQLDRYFVHYKSGPMMAWVGRNGFPFWQQNELILDEDVTPTGAAGTYESKQGTGKLTTTVGAFALPDGMLRLNGHMYGGQIKYSLPVEKNQLITAVDLYDMQGHNGARYLRNRNGARDYLIGALKTQWSTLAGGQPLAIGVDLIRNFESYSAADVAPLPARNTDQKTGYDVSLQWGQLKKAREWQLAYTYARIQTLAVNASYAQDDWVRFGANGQWDGTDIKGHEFRAAYAITKTINIVARAFFVKAITSVQDGNRFRVDVNLKF